MKKLLLLSALLIFACSSDDSSNDDDNNNNNNSGLLNCDGNPIPSIVYGSQEWTVENACHITYRDGTPIPQVADYTEWDNLTTGAWCYYDNDYPLEGKLYNWYAVMGIHDNDENTANKEFAPEGWHVPSDAEWKTLEEYLIANGYNYDGSSYSCSPCSLEENKIGKSMASTTGWVSSFYNGAVGNDQSLNNSSGFNALPRGYFDGLFGLYGEGGEAIFWTSTQEGNDAHYGLIDTDAMDFTRWQFPKINGCSVRFVKD